MQSYLLFHSFKYEYSLSMSSYCLSCQAKKRQKEVRKAQNSRTREIQKNERKRRHCRNRFFQAFDESGTHTQYNNQHDDTEKNAVM